MGQTLVRIVCDDLKAHLALRVAERQATDAVYRRLVNGARKEEREIAQDELILSEANVAVVSGDAFGDSTGVRVSYAIGTEQVEEGLLRMKQLFDQII